MTTCIRQSATVKKCSRRKPMLKQVHKLEDKRRRACCSSLFRSCFFGYWFEPVNLARASPLALSKHMKNGRSLTVISPNQPIVVKPAAEVITIRPSQMVVVKPASIVVIQPTPVDVITVQTSKPITVTPPVRGAWDERGWTRTVNGGRENYEGHYTVGARQFRGRIEARKRGRNVTVYI